MARYYASQQIGVIDGTQSPPRQADGRQVNAKKRVIIATKVKRAEAIADDIVLGELPQNSMITNIRICTDTSLGSATIAIGVPGTTGKYVAATTFTTPLNVPVTLGPKASVFSAGPEATRQTIIATVAAAALPVGADITFLIEYTTVA